VEVTPTATAGELSIAAAPTLSDFFGGQIDKLRVFTFAPGAFAVDDLLYTPPLELALALDAANVTGSWSRKHWLHRAESTTDLVNGPWTAVSAVSPVGQNNTFSEPRAAQKFYRLNLLNRNPYLPPGKFIVITSAGQSKNVTNLLAANPNRILGGQPSSIDASAFVDPANVDGGVEAMYFQWVVRYPQLDDPYTARGMTGYFKPVLSAVGNSYAQQPGDADIGGVNAPGVQFLLTVTSKRTGRSTVVDLRAQITISFGLPMYNLCQTETEANCEQCICTVAPALPEDELTQLPSDLPPPNP
jgi:hypothetical protein